MKLKKVLLVALTVIMFITFIMMSFTEVSAVKTETPIYIGLSHFMTENPNFGYAIGDPAANAGKTERVAATIWNLLKYDSATSTTYTDQEIYCLREGEGFLNSSGESDIGQIREYNESYNMKAEKEHVISKVHQWNKTIDGVDQYNAILAVLDLFYIEGSSAEGYRETLLENAIGKAQYQSYIDEQKITDADIKAVQQAALWYFTNYGENTNNLYDKMQNTAWLNYTEDGTNYTSLSGYKSFEGDRRVDIGLKRQEQSELLYKYFINTAKVNANRYADNSTSNVVLPAKVNTLKLEYVIDGENYIVGPINITEQESSNMLDSITLQLKGANSTIDTYTLLKEDKTNANTTNIKDLLGKDFYISIPKANLSISDLEVSFTINYSNTNLKLWTHSTNKTATQPVVIPQRESNSQTITLSIQENKTFDLALRKYITKIKKVDGIEVSYSRTPVIEEGTISSPTTTATYKHRKDPVLVETGDIVTYRLTIYNEGQKDGRATKVVDQLPTGLKFSKVVSGNFKLDSYSEIDNTLNLVRKENNSDNLLAYTQGNLDSETIEIECEVIATPDETNIKILTNVAWISEEIDVEGNVITNQDGLDIDSEPSTKPDVNKDNMENYEGNDNKSDLTDSEYYYKGQQDDDDFEKLKLMPESFDLKLIKRITAVNNQNVPERIEKVDVSKLNTIDQDGKLVTTADYKLNKTPVSVKQGDIVTYTFRIYNEGTIDGYATEITEDIPDGLEYLWDDGIEYTEGHINWDNVTKEFTDEEKEAIEFNFNNGWSYAGDSSLRTIKTDYLARHNETVEGDESNLIKAFGSNDETKTEADISYKEVSVKLKVVSEDVTGTIIRNEACISEDTNINGDPVDDRDSSTTDWKKEDSDKYYDEDKKWPIYEEDDEDYDNIILKAFDLSLRKFIIAVSDDDEIENEEYLKDDNGLYTRAPSVDTSRLNTIGEDGKLITTAIYNHTKEPVMVQKNDIVVYMLRVYNEGEIDGYASEIKDHLPPHLEFVEGKFNEKYGWEVSEDGRTVTTDYLKDENIKAAEEIKNSKDQTSTPKYKLTYKEVPIMCKVKDTAKSDENITNIADITKYLDENKESVNDRDSQENNVVLPEDDKLPSYKDDETGEYIPGQQDDDDFEKLIVKEFDLALRKWVTQAIVIDKNGETITETGHQPYDDPEQVVKVELNRKKTNQVTVKFRYSIRVINEGDIAGYAKEVTDYVPKGLKFVAEDNKGWTDEGNNVISTRLLENTLLQPGEYADVEVVLTWVNSQDNMGVMVNTAEISEDDNDYDVPDKDSTPDNQKPGEDDIDDAPVMLTVSTGQIRIYFTLGFVVLITIAGGIVLIKKYVL